MASKGARPSRDQIRHVIVSVFIGQGRQVTHDHFVPALAPRLAPMATSVVTHATVPTLSHPITQSRGSDRVWVALEARRGLQVGDLMWLACRILVQAEDRCVASLPPESVVAFAEAGSITTAPTFNGHLEHYIISTHVGVSSGHELSNVWNILLLTLPIQDARTTPWI